MSFQRKSRLLWIVVLLGVSVLVLLDISNTIAQKQDRSVNPLLVDRETESPPAQNSVVGVCQSTDAGLSAPEQLDATLSIAEVDAMTRLAVQRAGGLDAVIQPGDWVVIKVNILQVPGPIQQEWGWQHIGTETDLRVVRSVIQQLIDQGRASRITVAEGKAWKKLGMPGTPADQTYDGWTYRWADYGNLSYADMIAEFAAATPSIKVDYIDLDYPPYTADVPVPGGGISQPSYTIPDCILHCDKIIGIAPMKTHALARVTLVNKLYVGISPASVYTAPGAYWNHMGIPHYTAGGAANAIERTISDLVSYHPADLGIVEGIWGTEGEGPQGGNAIKRNVILASTDPVAVDAASAYSMGFNPWDIDYLHYCHNKGFGINNLNYITVNGPSLDDIRWNFKKPSRGPGFYQGRGNRTWLVNGPHSGTDIDENYLGTAEEEASPVEGDVTGAYTWTKFSGIDDYMDLAANYGAPTYCVTYAFTRIVAKTETAARLRFGADDGIKIWLNGNAVYTNGNTGSWSLVQQDVPITLQAGVNRLLVKIKNTTGNYGFSMFVCEPDGDTPMGISYSTLAADAPEIILNAPGNNTTTTNGQVTLSASVSSPGGNPLTMRFYGDAGAASTLLEEKQNVPSGTTVSHTWSAHPLNVDANTIALWHFDEGTGNTVYDASPNHNNGTLVNGATWVTGRFGSALHFNGQDQYVRVPDSDILNPTSAITIELWTYREDNRAWSKMLSKPLGQGEWPGPRYVIYGLAMQTRGDQVGNEIEFPISIDGQPIGMAPEGNSNGTVPLSEWHYIAVTFDGQYHRIYIDGVLDREDDTPGTIDPSDTPRSDLFIGSAQPDLPGVGGYYLGSLDEVRISNRARTAQEISNAYNVAVGNRLTVGDYAWKVTASDGGSESVSETRHFTVNDPTPDTTPPTITLNHPADGYTVTSTPVDLSATVDDPEGHRMTVRFFGGQSSNPATLLYEATNVTSPSDVTYAWSRLPQEMSAGDNTAALWHFNEGSGTTTADASPNVNTGTISGATWTMGRFGSGLDFNGTNAYVQVAPATSLDMTGDLTLEAWIYPRVLNKLDHVIMTKRDENGTCNYQMYINSDNDGLSFYAGGAPEYQEAGLVPTLNQWNYVAIVRSGTTLTFYLNGQTAQMEGPPSLAVNTEPLQIGCRSVGGTSEAFNGLIDEVRVTNRALAPGEIADDYRQDLEAGTYYWKVTADDGTNEAVSGTRHFDILGNMPPQITLNHPDDAWSTLAKSVELSATVHDPEGSAMTVRFYGDGNSNPTTLLYQQSGVTDPSTLAYVWGHPPQELSVQVPGTAALWHFNENSGGTTADATVNGNTGTISGAVWTTGKFGAGLSFDGVNDYVQVSDKDSLDVTGNLTLEAWIKPNALPLNQTVLTKRDGGGTCNYQMYVKDNSKGLSFYAGGSSEYHSYLVPVVGQWNYMAIVRSGATLTFYLNGASATMSGPASLTANDQPLQMGSRTVAGSVPEAFGGLIDEVRITRRALAPAEIAAGYSSELSEGVHYWKVTANDGQSTASSAVRSFAVTPDVTPPVITLTEPNDAAQIPGKSATLGATVHDPEGSSMSVSFYGGQTSDPTTLLYQQSGVVDPSTLTYVWGQAPRQFTVDPLYTAGLWHFDENTGTTALDATANHNNGTIYGAAWTAGKFGYALRFNGTSDYVEMPDASSLDITGAVTIEAWMRFESIQTDWRVIVGKVNTTLNQSNYHLSKSADNKFNFGFNSTGEAGGWHDGYSSNMTVSAGQWYYVAATYNDAANEVRIYIDGVQDALYSCPYSLVTNDLPLRIGMNNNGLEALNATIDEVRITSRTLTQQEIAANYSSELSEGRYYWKVVASDEKNNTAASAIRYFDMLGDVTPPEITLEHPAQGYVTADKQVELAARVHDPDGSSMTVSFYGDQTQNPSTLLYQASNVSDPSDVTYVWQGSEQELAVEVPATVALWHFNENSGTTTGDATANGNVGTLMRGPTWTTGRFGSALSFNGSTDPLSNNYVLVNAASSLDITGDLTLEAWIKPAALTYYHLIVAKRDAGASCDYQMSISATGEVLAFYDGVTEYRSNLVPTVGQWNYAAVVHSAGTLTFYLNGQTQTMAGPANLTPNSWPVQIGSRSLGNVPEAFNGTIDEVRITNRALSPAEIAASHAKSLAEGRYYWSVTASDGKHLTASDVRYFNIAPAAPPAVPALTAPPNLAVTNDNTPTFTWSATAGPGGAYTLEYALDAGFTSGVRTIPGIGAETYTVPDGEHLADNTYYWHVQAVDGVGRPSGYQTTPFSFTVNTQAPPPPSAFAVTPGNGKCHLSWTNPSATDFAGVMIRRSPWGDGAYPVYGGTPIGYPGGRTEGTLVYSGTAESFDDAGDPGTMPRNIYYYTIFSFDAAGNYSAASPAVERRATNYWLGDIVANGSVDFDDAVPFSNVFGTSTGGPGWNALCDFGPSENGSRFGVPMPDGVIDFEDLMLLAMNYGSVLPEGLELLAAKSGTALEDLAHLVAFEIVPGADNSYSIVLKNQAATLKGIHLVVEVSGGDLTRVERGSRIAGRSDVLFGVISRNGATDISMAELGVETPFKDSGELARLRISKQGDDNTVVRIKLIDLRDVDNARCEITSGEEYDAPFVPKATALMQNFPNPFNPSTVLTFDLVSPAHVTIQIFDVSGRLLRTLLDERQDAGRHHVEWNGINGNGSSVPSGIYFYRMQTQGYSATKKMIIIR
ncbi:MAG: LamG-like jellyroll fold domain-containing protein [Candidatus Krumholzibacteriaceae bacterium]